MPFGGLLTVGLIGAGSSIFSGLMGKSAAQKAAEQQQAAAQKAAGAATDLLNPYAQGGQASFKNLQELLAPGGDLTKGYQSFTPPDPNQVANTPEYQFAQQQGMKGLEHSAAAHGHLLQGGTYRDISQFNQGLASQQYQNAFGNALGTYNANFNTFNTNGTNLYNRLLGLSNTGMAASSDLSHILEQAYTGSGNAQAAGTVGGAQSLSNGIVGAGNTLASLYALTRPMGNGTNASNSTVAQQYQRGW